MLRVCEHQRRRGALVEVGSGREGGEEARPLRRGQGREDGVGERRVREAAGVTHGVAVGRTGRASGGGQTPCATGNGT